MQILYLAVSVIGAYATFIAYHPIRREPLSVVSFFVGWLVGELAVQNMVCQMLVSAVFVAFGALAGWAGWLGLAISTVSWAGLVGLYISGDRADEVMLKALLVDCGALLNANDQLASLIKPKWGRWWRTALAIPRPDKGIEQIKNVDYFGDGDKRHRLDILRSKSVGKSVDKSVSKSTIANGNAPILIHVHGGAWLTGKKNEQARPMLYELVANGWICVTINYRLSPTATWPDQIVDIKKAISWVREHADEYGGDSSFIALSGGSAGGHLSALAALTSCDSNLQPGFEGSDTSVMACVPFYGVMDLSSDNSGSKRYKDGLMKLLERWVMKLSSIEHPEVFEMASPTHRVHSEAPPFFVIHGKNDTLVPCQMAREFVKALKGVSKQPVVYAELPRAQHAFDILYSPRCRAVSAGAITFLNAVYLSLIKGDL